MNEAERCVFLAGRFDPGTERTFSHEPFDVPDGVQQMRVQVSYNNRIASDPRVQGGNVLDIGLFDARGTESGGAGFRGWSGSNKLDLVIGEAWSTPPYVAGSLQPGIWYLLLGAYKIGPEGLDWEARITWDPEPEVPRTMIPPVIPLPDSRTIPHRIDGWYCGDLHNHTVFSDGSGWPIDVAARAKAEGLDFYGITDHNRAQSPVGLVPHGEGWPILVPGVEVTTYAGHFNVWGTDHWYDFRDPTADGLQHAVDAAVADGGFVSMNHPKPFGPDWEYPHVTGFHGIEAWNGWWSRMNSISTRVWESMCARDRYPTPISGSDMHQVDAHVAMDNPFAAPVTGYPTLWVRVEGILSAESILDALHRGDVSISDAPDGPQIVVEPASGTVRVVRGKGHALIAIVAGVVTSAFGIATDDMSFPDLATAGTRFEVHAAIGGVRALSNIVRHSS